MSLKTFYLITLCELFLSAIFIFQFWPNKKIVPLQDLVIAVDFMKSDAPKIGNQFKKLRSLFCLYNNGFVDLRGLPHQPDFRGAPIQDGFAELILNGQPVDGDDFHQAMSEIFFQDVEAQEGPYFIYAKQLDPSCENGANTRLVISLIQRSQKLFFENVVFQNMNVGP